MVFLKHLLSSLPLLYNLFLWRLHEEHVFFISSLGVESNKD